jgi:A/G-specific adenine glycosylase
MNLAAFQQDLLRWYRGNARDLPWRKTRDPYAIWVSEIMLQQTRVATVIPYYERFLAKFPTPAALAAAPEQEVLSLWAGLGYYSRARNLHQGAKEVVARFGGTVPNDPEQIKTLPGIGAYTAGAILSIAYQRDEALLDGNVARVLSRLYAVEGDPRLPAQSKRLWDFARGIIPTGEAGDMNQALMELGARVCSPTSPACLACPVRAHCQGAAHASPERFGAREKKKEVPTARALGVLFWVDASYVLARRPNQGLLGGLWELPSTLLLPGETNEQASARLLRDDLRLSPAPSCGPVLAEVEHVFTHLRLTLSLCVAQHGTAPKETRYPEIALIPRGQSPTQPLPALTKKALAMLGKRGAL